MPLNRHKKLRATRSPVIIARTEPLMVAIDILRFHGIAVFHPQLENDRCIERVKSSRARSRPAITPTWRAAKHAAPFEILPE